MTCQLDPIVESIYKSSEHAVRRAFGEVIPDYGTFKWPGVRPGSAPLPALDQIAQDAMVLVMCEEHLSRREFALLVCRYGWNPSDPGWPIRAGAEIARYVETWCYAPVEFILQEVVRHAARSDLKKQLKAIGMFVPLREWEKRSGIAKSTLFDRQKEIGESLALLLAHTMCEVEVLLKARGLV